MSDIENLKNSYLNLLRECLLDNIYGKQKSIDAQGTVISSVTDAQIAEGLYWPERAHTMIGRNRLDNVRYVVEKVLSENIPGDLIETGVWRGGATIFMKGILNANNDINRKVYVADSFEGLPKPDPKYPVDNNDPHHTFDFLKISVDEVKKNFEAYNLLDEKVIFVKGFFETSLKNANINKLSVLRLDGDMYSSTIQVLEQLYDKVSIGGFIIIDDYTLPGAYNAVIDFRKLRNITDEIIPIDVASAYWRKSK